MDDDVIKAGGAAKVVKELFSLLPLKRLSPNQTFDLAFDLLMLLLLCIAAFMNFGAHNAEAKMVLVFVCLGFMAWSFKSNT
jgi:hypothetical protein